ncbi:hypothetical protein K0M31_008285 [Melipona bicolor]|uniref:Uncharacterized protein n=1 Tax=Melipona bicolor TaxID=60889 RepID=A0AA40FRE9_9HYME|nr:hypothetical protein K0M31_008285 [Melipona bicolor]
MIRLNLLKNAAAKFQLRVVRILKYFNATNYVNPPSHDLTTRFKNSQIFQQVTVEPREPMKFNFTDCSTPRNFTPLGSVAWNVPFTESLFSLRRAFAFISNAPDYRRRIKPTTEFGVFPAARLKVGREPARQRTEQA